MKNNWSLKKCIKDRVQREDDARWAKSSEQGFTPRYEPHSASHKPSVGWFNFFKSSIESFVLEFRP